MAMGSGIGAKLAPVPECIPAHGFWFGEDQARYVLAVADGAAMLAKASAAGVPARLIGAASLLDLPAGGAGRTGGVVVGPERVAGLFEEAYASVGPGEGRFLRSLIAFDAGITLTRLGRLDEATPHLERALATSRSLGDIAGIASALMVQASMEAGRNRHADVLRMLDEAEPLMRRTSAGNLARLMALYTQRLRSLVALERHSELPAAVAGALALADSGVQPAARERLERAVAAGQAALGQHALAYQSMERAHRLAEEASGQANRAQVLRLQTLYDQSLRESEMAELRYAKEAARLSLLAQQATSRTLWVALAATAVLMAGAAAVGWQQWARRREMAELALRDTLTGLPNRRAIEAYARAQLSQSRRLKLPFSLAMIDLDHFKAVNDRHGHATGDAVLRALAQAAPLVLRAPDRLGRWGGEEFLLVLPGTARHELPGLYRRLRDAFAAAPVPGLPQPHGCSFSMGAAEATGHADHIEALIDTADRRLYEAKAAGRDRLA
jgi:diguanylate cyclase (GGDEF)-like protein